MEKKDYPEFLQTMVGLAEVLGPKELSEAQLLLYWNALKSLSIEQFRRSVELVVSTSKFFPKPAELISAITLDASGEAIVAYDKAIEIDPEFAEAWYNKGITLDKLGKHEEAVVCYNKIGMIQEAQ